MKSKFTLIWTWLKTAISSLQNKIKVFEKATLDSVLRGLNVSVVSTFPSCY